MISAQLHLNSLSVMLALNVVVVGEGERYVAAL